MTQHDTHTETAWELQDLIFIFRGWEGSNQKQTLVMTSQIKWTAHLSTDHSIQTLITQYTFPSAVHGTFFET